MGSVPLSENPKIRSTQPKPERVPEYPGLESIICNKTAKITHTQNCKTRNQNTTRTREEAVVLMLMQAFDLLVLIRQWMVKYMRLGNKMLTAKHNLCLDFFAFRSCSQKFVITKTKVSNININKKKLTSILLVEGAGSDCILWRHDHEDDYKTWF